MTFSELLDQAIALLQQRGRLTYRTLKRQFALDDETLDDLKVELIRGQRLAVDEDGEVLVWTGTRTTRPPTEPASETKALQPRIDSPTAERRQLTVMFCDLVDYTSLSQRLDPEELREVVRAYQQTCSEVVERFDGHVAQLLGDGLLVYFGWPRAHEDDAQRAARSGLHLLDAMEALNDRLP